MEREIRCEFCCGEIKYNSDLVVTTEFLSLTPRPYHEKCYAKKTKEVRGSFLNDALNTGKATFGTVVVWLLALVLLWVDLKLSGLMGIIAVLQTYLRVYSLLRFEKPLENLHKIE